MRFRGGDTATSENSPMETVAPVTSDNSSEATDNSESSEGSEETSSATQGEKNERGNLTKAIGEEASVTSKDGKNIYSFKVTGITPDAQCTDQYAQPSENGHLVKLDVEVVTGDAKTMEDNYYSSVYMGSSSWKYITAEGTTYNGDLGSVAAMMCLDDAETLPIDIGPAEKVTGSMILDLPNLDGTLVYEDTFAEGGWEYPVQ